MHKSKYGIIAIVLLIIVVGLGRITLYSKTLKENQNQAPLHITQEIKNFPSKAGYLNVPFYTQAPLETAQNWTLHENSCEEAATLMAYLYETGKNMTKEQANDEILRMINWQMLNFGDHHDIYADEVLKLINGFYKVPNDKIEVIYKATIDDIKNEIRQGHPVIVPITGDILNNPYYPYPGYHMLAVIGFTEKTIITNDNGTRHGANYEYDYPTFIAAMNDAGGDIVTIKLKQASSPKPPTSDSNVE